MALKWARNARCARLAIAVAAIFAAAFASAPEAAAQTYPTKPIRIVVPYAAGGITDILARALGLRLGEALGQQIVIDNRPGANSQVGAEIVARAAPDGYTLLVSADTTFVMNPHLTPKVAYDPLVDFIPVSGLGISPQALVVHPSVSAKTMSELIALARAKPGELNYGTFGIGSSGHLNIELLQSLTGTKFTAVHYKGAAPALTDLIGGHIQMMIVSIGLVTQAWQTGQLTMLGFGSTARIPQYAQVPTIAETLPGYEAASWYGLVAPAGTPRAIVDKLSAETQRIFAEPAFREKFLAPSMIFSIAGTPEDFAQRIEADYAKWGKVIRDANVKVE
jgi:tripartite-type tricarboxylate transporter receptor subunit TctC